MCTSPDYTQYYHNYCIIQDTMFSRIHLLIYFILFIFIMNTKNYESFKRYIIKYLLNLILSINIIILFTNFNSSYHHIISIIIRYILLIYYLIIYTVKPLYKKPLYKKIVYTFGWNSTFSTKNLFITKYYKKNIRKTSL